MNVTKPIFLAAFYAFIFDLINSFVAVETVEREKGHHKSKILISQNSTLYQIKLKVPIVRFRSSVYRICTAFSLVYYHLKIKIIMFLLK